jgi:hypothetical protein
MKLVVKTLVTFAALGVASDAAAQTAAISLAIPPSARSNAMGQAGVALADDATATWWNNGLLGFLDNRSAIVTHAQLVPDLADDVFHEHLAYAQPFSWGNLGFSLIYLSYGESQATGPVGEDLGTFRSYEFSPAISYGTKFADQLGVGVSFKYVRVQLAPDLPTLPPGSGTGSTVAVDLGLLWRVPGDRLNIGVALQNLGPDITFVEDERSDPIYRNAKAGFAATVYNANRLHALVAADVNQLLVKGEVRDADDNVRSRYGKPIWNGGGEVGYAFGEVSVALRGGYMHDDDGSISDTTFGGGIGYKLFTLDFASVPQAEDKDSGTKLDRVSKFSLSANF